MGHVFCDKNPVQNFDLDSYPSFILQSRAQAEELRSATNPGQEGHGDGGKPASELHGRPRGEVCGYDRLAYPWRGPRWSNHMLVASWGTWWQWPRSGEGKRCCWHGQRGRGRVWHGHAGGVMRTLAMEAGRRWSSSAMFGWPWRALRLLWHSTATPWQAELRAALVNGRRATVVVARTRVVPCCRAQQWRQMVCWEVSGHGTCCGVAVAPRMDGGGRGKA